jgi:nucleotide-binding universal stress UspA family protein
VGVDDGTAGDAVDWAAAEATTRGCHLRIVHAFRPPLPADPYGYVTQIDGFLPVRAAAELVLREAVARARAVASDIDVSTHLIRGSAARGLLGEAPAARLLVVGSHGRSGLRGLLAGSVAIHVATHASSPVVVIRPTVGACVDGSASRSVARVVVGVDRTPSCTPAIGFAFQAAWQRGIPLTAVHAWTPDPPADFEAVSGPSVMAELFGNRAVEKALARWRDEFPCLPVVTRRVRGDPTQTLITEPRGAALIVVGSRGRGHILGAVPGSVSQNLLHHAHCPIAIVQHGCRAEAEPPTGIHQGMVSSARPRRRTA